MPDFKPIAPGEHSPEKLDATLKYFKKAGFLDDKDHGTGKRVMLRSEADPYGQAKYAAEKVLRFFQDVTFDDGLSDHPPVAGVTAAMEVAFAAELFALDVLNADNAPITKEELQAARDAAFKYYSATVKDSER